MSQSRIIGALEIGTHKVVVLVGEVENGRRLNIIGKGECTSEGVQKGEVSDFAAASECAHAALAAAEKSAGATLEGCYLAQTGRHLQGFFSKGTANISAADNTVELDDILRAQENAKRKELPPDRLYIHHVRCGYKLDGEAVSNPHGMAGSELEVGYWHVHGEAARIRDAIHLVNHYGVEVDDLIVSSLASACMTATEAERSGGVLVLDVGRGTTDYALYHRGRITRTGVLAVGGDHLTNDLCLGLRLDRGHAEELKLEMGHVAAQGPGGDEKVWVYGDLREGNSAIGNRCVPRKAIGQILQARVREIFEIVRKELGGRLRAEDVPAGVVLAGGTSRLPGIAETAANVFGLPARLGENPEWVMPELRGPEYATSLGLLYYGLTARQSDEPARTSGSRLLRKVAGLLPFNLR